MGSRKGNLQSWRRCTLETALTALAMASLLGSLRLSLPEHLSHALPTPHLHIHHPSISSLHLPYCVCPAPARFTSGNRAASSARSASLNLRFQGAEVSRGTSVCPTPFGWVRIASGVPAASKGSRVAAAHFRAPRRFRQGEGEACSMECCCVGCLVWRFR